MATAPVKSRRTVAIVAALAFLAAVGGLAVFNFYIAQHRLLHLINGLSTPVNVSIDGGPATTLSGPFPTTVPIAEGKHHITVSGGLTEELDIEVSTDFFERFFSSPVFVLNPGGTSLLTCETVVYTQNPLPNGGGSSVYRYGESYIKFPNVNYVFAPFPKTITSDSHSSETRVRVGLVEESVAKVLVRLLSESKDEEALRIAEWDLKLHPEDTRTLELYAAVIAGSANAARARAFIQERCRRKPVQIEWHRVYQQLSAGEQERSDIAAEYDQQLASEPGNASLLYLRGLVCRNGQRARPLFEQAIVKDAKLPWAHAALGQYYSARGDWTKARPHLEAAHQLAPDNEEFADLFDDARVALGECATLETDLRRALPGNAGDIKLNTHLCDALIAQHKNDEARTLAENYEALLSSQEGNDGLGLGRSLHEYVLYAIGDFPLLEKTAPKGTNLQYQTLFELGKLKELCELSPLKLQAEPFWCLAMSAGWKDAGDEANAKAWREKAAEIFAQTTEGSRAATLLRGIQPPTLDAVADLGLSAKQEATLLAVFAQLFPERADEFRAVGRALNYDFAFPHHFLVRALK
jgi:tetratricopeptide (TPR) repeat protein